jgi:hypothetical protein
MPRDQAIHHLRSGPRGVDRLFNRFRPKPQPEPQSTPHPGSHPGSKVIPYPYSEPESLCFAFAVAAAWCPEGRCSNTNPGT